MDLSQFSTDDLLAMKSGDLSKVSTPGLQLMRQMQAHDSAAADTAAWAAHINPTDGMSFMDKFNAGAGKAFSDLGTGIDQRVGLVSRDDVAESRKLDAPLMKTGAGVTGNLMGNLSLLAPASLAPGAAAVPAAATIGAITGYLQPSVSLQEDAINTGLGAVAGATGQFIAGKAGVAAAGQEADNAVKTAQGAQKAGAAKAAKDAGYVIPPEDIGQGGGVVTKVLSGVGGKIKTAQVASEANQGTTNTLARKALGVGEDVPLNVDTLNAIRKQAGAAYENIRGAGSVATDSAFDKAISDIATKYKTAVPSFPGLGKTNMHGQPVDEIGDLVKAMKSSSQFDASEAVDAISLLRETADKAFRAGDKTIGKANKDAATALEDLVGRHLQALGNGPMLDAFQQARQLIAKTYSVQKGLNGSTGDVASKALVQQLEKGKPLSDELLTIAQAGQSFPKATQALKEAPKSISPLDVAFAASQAGPGKWANLLSLGARPAARSILLSNAMQNAAVNAAQTPAPANALLRILSNQDAALPLSITAGNAMSRQLQR